MKLTCFALGRVVISETAFVTGQAWYPIIILAAFFLFVLICCFYGISRRVKKTWQSIYLIQMSFALLIFASISLINSIHGLLDDNPLLVPLAAVGIIPIPALINLHIRSQLSHMEIKPVFTWALFAPLIFLILVLFRDTLAPYLFPQVTPLYASLVYQGIFFIHSSLLILSSYFHCLNALHQMPSHMRGSTKYIFVGIMSFSVLFLNIFLSGTFPVLIPISESFDSFFLVGAPVTLVILLYTFFMAQNIAPAEDVIVTSRELIMGGLNTTVLVLNNEEKILDWNKNAWDNDFPLPVPKFLESMASYRQRLGKIEGGKVSPHSENIIIASKGGKEIHYLLETHQVEFNNRNFGYIAEITEITSIYSTLRYFEEIANIDTLTGLFNRNAYFEHVKHVATRENMPLLIFVGDVNYLKTVNDNFGHVRGDELLKTVADIIKRASPEAAFVARTGGDEFVVLVPRGNVEMASNFMQKIIAYSEEINHEVFGSPSISWGYSIMKYETDSYNTAFERADAMMYEYKKTRHSFRSSSLLPVS